jgi:ATPase family associated with various cellular activities (AAA)
VKKTVQEHKLTHYQILPARLPGEGFSIFKQVARNKTLADFRSYVLNETAPEGVPIGAFDRIKTADVREIEDLRTIGKLLQSYLSRPSGSSKPLAIAVFGPPGAGKSTAVKCIIENLPKACQDLVRDARHECNLAALADPEDLAHYFQLARDAALRGKVPVLFFDEFDCAIARAQYFWLKHFLGPIQDGEFRSGHIVYPIGRAIFVFAGGVSKTFHDFETAMEANRNAAQDQALADPADRPASTGARGGEGRAKDNKSAAVKRSSDVASGSLAGSGAKPPQANFKGVDFLSRLHGHIDVAGLSPEADKPAQAAAFYPSAKDETAIVVDPSYLMRRAFTLRSVLKFHAPGIFSQGSPQVAHIDPGIVDALLVTKTFKHGTRSMEAVIRMSSLEGRDSFEQSHLPPDNQLNMHSTARTSGIAWSTAPIPCGRRMPRRKRRPDPEGGGRRRLASAAGGDRERGA